MIILHAVAILALIGIAGLSIGCILEMMWQRF